MKTSNLAKLCEIICSDLGYICLFLSSSSKNSCSKSHCKGLSRTEEISSQDGEPCLRNLLQAKDCYPHHNTAEFPHTLKQQNTALLCRPFNQTSQARFEPRHNSEPHRNPLVLNTAVFPVGYGPLEGKSGLSPQSPGTSLALATFFTPLADFSIDITSMYSYTLCTSYHYITLNLLLHSSICLLSNAVIRLTVVRLTACNVSSAAL